MCDVMDLECPSCGERAIMRDYHGTDEHYVCVECGSLVENSGLVSTKYDVGGEIKQFVPSKVGQSKTSKCPGFQNLVSYLETICLLLKVLPEIEELAKDHFNTLYNLHVVKYKGMESKEYLVLACVYISCRQHNALYTLLEIAKLARCNVFNLGNAYKTAVQLLGLSLEQSGIGALSRQLFSQSNLTVPVISRAHELLHLSNKFWLVSGRNPVGLLLAVSYISWKTDKPMERCKISAQKYCKEHKLTFSPMVKQRISEIEKVLFHLALELPWVKTEPIKERLPFLVNDILNYQKSLILEMERNINNEKNNEEQFPFISKNNYGEILPPIMKKKVKKVEESEPYSVALVTCCDKSDSEDLDRLNVDDYIKSEKEIEALKNLE
ncbi:transcription factor IIIB 50 kDa subunit [Octopus bimaculoides]|uniref:TFIIB-type domain-containing protein n=1 Tax=Octopus bimaculoides TaxID=37653 RepID=A0A0L8GEE9_OCTBM|nr:transcription factor IIIB 50 kDa subunit [Octopus bimaculoides]|eukprot:XP_014782034.1 PREDICTED: transcription factor IIIB 50 kDa subunit-like [Octopus bimaculoides]